MCGESWMDVGPPCWALELCRSCDDRRGVVVWTAECRFLLLLALSLLDGTYMCAKQFLSGCLHLFAPQRPNQNSHSCSDLVWYSSLEQSLASSDNDGRWSDVPLDCTISYGLTMVMRVASQPAAAKWNRYLHKVKRLIK